jgi:hypothetical protein
MVRAGWLQKGNANQTGASIDGTAFYTAHQSVEVGTCDGVDRSDDLILVPVLRRELFLLVLRGSI